MTRLRRLLRRHRRRLVVLLALWASLGWLRHDYRGSGRGPADPPYLTVFLLDGLSQEVFQTELAAGRLPNMAKLIDEGLYVVDGISSFPSMTAYGFYPFITGHDAAASGALGLRWFDKSRERGNFRAYVGTTSVFMNQDFVARPQTVYERFEQDHSLSINTYCNRGVEHDSKFGISFSLAKYQGIWWLSDWLRKLPLVGHAASPTWEGAEDRVTAHAISELAERPKVQWITFTSPDGYQHINGTTERYAEIVRYIDVLIGRYRQASAELGQEPHRIYAMVTDHGVETVTHNLDMRKELLDCCKLRVYRGQSTVLFGSKLQEPLDMYADFDAVQVINGNLLSYLYLREPSTSGADGWHRRLSAEELARYQAGGQTVDLLEKLVAMPGVEFVIARKADGSAVLRGRDGTATIRADADGLSYRVEGSDPLGYDGVAGLAKLLDGRGHSAAEWLETTHATRYPDAVARVHGLMQAPGTGDLVLTAAPGYDFGADYERVVGNYRGGHGGLRSDQMRVPYVIAGPKVKAGTRIATARNEDVGATLLTLLGAAPEPNASGRVLREGIRER